MPMAKLGIPSKGLMRELTMTERRLTRMGPYLVKHEKNGNISFWHSVRGKGYQLIEPDDYDEIVKILKEFWNG